MTFTRTTMLLATAAAMAALAACGHSSTSSVANSPSGSISFRDEQLVITAADHSEALVSPEGRLAIAGQYVSVTEGQRAQLVAYYNAASGVFQHAASTGVAGAEVGVTAATSVASGLAKGDMSDVKARIEAQTAEVRRQALKICEKLGEVRAAQDALSGQIPAFRPYAVVSERETTDCARDLKNMPGN